MMLSERENFLEAIDSDPYDLALRKVFADWLDEFGNDADHDLAVVQREWTEEKTRADLAIKKVAAEAELTYEEVVNLVSELEYFDTYDYQCDGRLYLHLYRGGLGDSDQVQHLLNAMKPLIPHDVLWESVIADDEDTYRCSC